MDRYRLWTGLALPLLWLAAPPGLAQTIGNQDVLSLLEAGVGEDAMIAQIDAAETDFALDAAALDDMRSRGVPEGVIAAMRERAAAQTAAADASPDLAVPHSPGIYLMDDWSPEPRMWKIEPVSSRASKTTGVMEYLLTGGLASMKVKAVIPGQEAAVTARKSTPVFYLFMDPADITPSRNFATGGGISTVSPRKYALVRFGEKAGEREARIGSFGYLSLTPGVPLKDRIPFDFEQVRPGVFRITVANALEQGQYGFIGARRQGLGPGNGGPGEAGTEAFAFAVE